MKVLIVEPGPAFSVQDVASGWKAGFEHHGHQVVSYNLGERCEYHFKALKASGKFEDWAEDDLTRMTAMMAAEGVLADAMELWPDVVLVVSSFYMPPKMLDVLRARGFTVVVHLTESPYEDDNQYAMAEHGDLVLINDPTNLDTFTSHNPNTIYQPHGYNPSVHYRREHIEDAVCEFCFVGTAYPSRIEFLEQVDFTGIDVALAGNWADLTEDSPLAKFVAHDREQCVNNSTAAELYSNAQVSLNLYRVEAMRDALSDGWAMGPREVELATLETFFLRQARPESDQVLGMLPTVTSPDDFSTKLRWWLNHPDLARSRALEARAAVADRSYPHFVSALLERI